ncbi:thiamine pyrophosphate-binding protein [Adhaeribacter radiodurans]|uniref:Thiamine pyrophosphate-binding protein n=1 Tax=Adhaeribacter radiodurans TaxID=2745197 RepID=A0A7L7L807_9BACT|nr:thiamine pyrophosphate-binding protein [Adhaeribacter radiodurans]QMU28962.1 thiamine pyrophosphate-binding protein [Adhaeribacter radiodurans]
MIKLSDFIFKYLADNGVSDIFLVTGGGAMHLNDSIGKEKRINYICNHHEQASAIAAEGYARVKDSVGVINVTSGPGGINALNGVFGAWTDSIPLLVLSGQVKRETLMSGYNIPGLRQLGDQEVDIIRMVQGITKYAVLVTEPNSIKYHLQRALHLAMAGRPGPCWLDIPVDVQGSMINEEDLFEYDPKEDQISFDLTNLPDYCQQVIQKIKDSERPALLVSTGIRLARATDLLEQVADKLGIPVTTAWSHDVFPHDHPLYCGKQGTIGDRPGNFTVQNADAVLIVGSRMPIRQVSYNWDNFARCAYKIQVDVDQAELSKPTFKVDLPLHYDAKVFLEEMNRQLDQLDYNASKYESWLNWCKQRVDKYPVLQAKHINGSENLNPYYFLYTLNRQLNGKDVIVCGDATACIVTFQTSYIVKGQRLFSNSGSASMGYDLPAAIGAAVANKGQRIICLAGDGSIQMNIQELQTVVHYQLPIKIFILNNGGYLSIKSTQNSFFKQAVGSGPESGVSFPDMEKIGNAYGIPSFRIEGNNFKDTLEKVLAAEGPALINVILDEQQLFEPKLSSKQLPDGRMVSAPLEDMFPFLEKEELMQNLLIPAIKF